MNPLRHLRFLRWNKPRWEFSFTLGVVILAVAIPTAGLLYYMNRSINAESQQLLGEVVAGRQKSLDSVAGGIRNALQKRLQLPPVTAAEPQARFAEAVETLNATGILILGKEGEIRYPILTKAEVFGGDDEATLRNEDLMNDHLDQILERGQVPEVESFLKLTDQFGRKRFQQAQFPNGRFVLPHALFAALQEMPASHPRKSELTEQLKKMVLDIKLPLPTTQRLFLAQQLRELGEPVNLPHEQALAASLHLAGHYAVPSKEGEFTLVSADDSLFVVRPAGLDVAVFLKKEPLIAELTTLANSTLASTGMTASIHTHGERKPVAEPIASRSIGALIPGWELSAFGEDASVEIAHRLNRMKWIHRVSAILGCFLIVALATWAIRRFTASAKLTQAKHDFLSIVSHELKTPLTSIRMFVDSLADGGLDDAERAKTYLKFIRSENERLSRLVENFLTFSRIEGGRMNFDFHVVHPEDIAEAVKGAVEDRCIQANCRFHYTADPDLPLLKADNSALTTALVNLIDNSIKYSREDKEVNFRVSKEGTSVIYSVTDNGIGMSEETFRRLGEKFYRDRSAIQSGRGGFGLGLHIVHSIVEAHGGKVRIESTPGLGTRITISLPASPEASL